MSNKASVLEALKAVVGADAVLSTESQMQPHAVDWRRYYHGRPLAVVKPASTQEVAAVMGLCRMPANSWQSSPISYAHVWLTGGLADY